VLRAYFFFGLLGFTFCVSAEAATDFTAFGVDLERSSLLAIDATFLLVVSLFLAIRTLIGS
jgi:hypothetical protein